MDYSKLKSRDRVRQQENEENAAEAHKRAQQRAACINHDRPLPYGGKIWNSTPNGTRLPYKEWLRQKLEQEKKNFKK